MLMLDNPTVPLLNTHSSSKHFFNIEEPKQQSGNKKPNRHIPHPRRGASHTENHILSRQIFHLLIYWEQISLNKRDVYDMNKDIKFIIT